jgi:N-acetylglucosaminyldiphosphoundecaprenol N-acetyl-beta-D-mannosaminyltransferase
LRAVEPSRTTGLSQGPPDPRAGLRSRSIIGIRVDATSYGDATERIIGWAERREPRYVCVATVNDLIEARDDRGYATLLDRADLVTPDGVPLVWSLRALGIRTASRVYGPDLTPLVCAAAARSGVPVGFYGGNEEVLSTLTSRLSRQFPSLDIAYTYAPPFRPLTAQEDASIVRDIKSSGARVLFVGLGAPKQVRWMAAHAGQLETVMIGVGAAFDFLAGVKQQAPSWIQAIGMEWAYRLLHEPRRLWRRYVLRNPRFVCLIVAQLLARGLAVGPAKAGTRERAMK